MIICKVTLNISKSEVIKIMNKKSYNEQKLLRELKKINWNDDENHNNATDIYKNIKEQFDRVYKKCEGKKCKNKKEPCRN